MQLAAWLDVALEGGVTELERALADCRALRRLLEGDWRLHARRVERLASDVRERWEAAGRAIDRAQRRAKVDEAAKPGLVLAERVERARADLWRVLAVICPRRGQALVKLDWLCEAAEEESHYANSMLRFRGERVAWTGALMTMVPAVPFSAWWVASDGGRIGTVFSADGLAEPQALILCLVIFALVIVSTLRLSSWSWLGAPRPTLLSPLLGSALFALTADLLLDALGGALPLDARRGHRVLAHCDAVRLVESP